MNRWVSVTLVCSLFVPALGSAQEPAENTATPPIPPIFETQGHATEEPPPGPPVVPPGEGEPAPVRAHHWYDDFAVNMYADAFYMVDWNHPRRADAEQNVAHRAYDFTNGFALAFAGLDLSYAREHFGATVSLIYGRGADRYFIGTYTPGFFPLKQAFMSWLPKEGVSIDFGQFDTPFGAEVAQSWLNLNYSRTPLNYLMQPFYHTGIRATWQVTDAIMLRGLLVNGINNGIDSNLVPSVGGQFGFTPSDSLSLYLGYLGGAPDAMNQNDPAIGAYGRSNKFSQHFFDAVLTAKVNAKLKFVVNGDFWMYNPPGSGGRQLAGGISAAVGYQVTRKFGVAARGDYLNNADHFFLTGTCIPNTGGYPIGQFGTCYSNLGSVNPWTHLGVATLTFDYRPLGNHAIVRLEQRFEKANTHVYPTGNFGTGGSPTSLTDPLVQSWINDLRNWWTATTLSLVVQMAE